MTILAGKIFGDHHILRWLAVERIGDADFLDADVVGNLGFDIEFLNGRDGDVAHGEDHLHFRWFVGRNGDVKLGLILVLAVVGIDELHVVGDGLLEIDRGGVECRIFGILNKIDHGRGGEGGSRRGERWGDWREIGGGAA